MKTFLFRFFVIPTIVVACMQACSSSTPAPMSDAAKQESAGATYATDMMLCRDKEKFPTLAQSDACLAATRTRWHRLPDGGSDGTFTTDGGAK